MYVVLWQDGDIINIDVTVYLNVNFSSFAYFRFFTSPSKLSLLYTIDTYVECRVIMVILQQLSSVEMLTRRLKS